MIQFLLMSLLSFFFCEICNSSNSIIHNCLSVFFVTFQDYNHCGRIDFYFIMLSFLHSKQLVINI